MDELTKDQKDFNAKESKQLLEMIGGGKQEMSQTGLEYYNGHFTISLIWKHYADKTGLKFRFALSDLTFETIEDLGKMVKCLREIWRV